MTLRNGNCRDNRVRKQSRSVGDFREPRGSFKWSGTSGVGHCAIGVNLGGLTLATGRSGLPSSVVLLTLTAVYTA